MPTLPAPHKLGENCTRWRLSELLAFEAGRNGSEPPEIGPEEDCYLTVKQVAARYSCGVNTVWRWSRESAEREATLGN